MLKTVAIVWLGVCTIGLLALLDYSKAPNSLGSPSVRWPADSKIPLAKDKPTMIMLVHPKCPCTRASIGELAWIMTRAQERVATYVLLVKPEHAAVGWENTDLETMAASIPGVTVFVDEKGAEAKRFGAETSGETLVYDADGFLKFKGGITLSRGHSGQNAGRDNVLSLLTTGTVPQSESPVFGCSLLNNQCPRRTKTWKILNWIPISVL